jgi:UDP-galactopyranose mutase
LNQREDSASYHSTCAEISIPLCKGLTQSIIVFSHLRWDFVFQRPQHILSRLAKHYQIVFFEEPEFQANTTELLISYPTPNVTVCRPITPVSEPGFHDQHMSYLRPMLHQLLAGQESPIAWFYTPMALPLLEEVEAQHVVYDCMDELSAFKNAPAKLLEYENRLLEISDIVFTSGPSLYNAKRHRHANVHCFPSSVDASHFRQARDRNSAHPAMRELPKPRLGFYGVIDERFDPGIIRHMASIHPEWQIILAGPIVNKVDSASLPQQANIHYVGQQVYNDLPKLLAAWDVCLMPFALNESTKFISPTKSLEYMAAELPIVSTPVKDVVDLHSDVIEIAEGAHEFVAACERVLSASSAEKLQKVRLMRAKLSKTSWDVVAASMHVLLEELEIDNSADFPAWAVGNPAYTPYTASKGD